MNKIIKFKDKTVRIHGAIGLEGYEWVSKFDLCSPCFCTRLTSETKSGLCEHPAIYFFIDSMNHVLARCKRHKPPSGTDLRNEPYRRITRQELEVLRVMSE